MGHPLINKKEDFVVAFAAEWLCLYILDHLGGYPCSPKDPHLRA